MPPSTIGLHPQLAAPSLVYLTGEDVVQLVSWNSLAAVKLKARLRILTADGRIVVYPLEQTPATNRTQTSSSFTPVEGWIIAASVEASAGTPSRGQTFAALRIVRGAGAINEESATIAADYVTSQQRLAYPGSGVRSSLDGAGFFRLVTGTVPGAGADITEATPSGARWRLVGFRAALTTSAAVANRDVQLILDDGANEYWRQAANANQTASLTFTYAGGNIGDRANGASVNDVQFATPAGAVMMPGWRFRTSTALIDVADQWAVPRYAVEEWIEAA